MEWLDRLVHGFIMTFGITQPDADKKKAANLFIGSLQLIICIGLVGMIAFGIRHLVH